jgi:hypothetical protein
MLAPIRPKPTIPSRMSSALLILPPGRLPL